MKQSITIKVPLQQVEKIILDYGKQFFGDETLELKHNIKDLKDSDNCDKLKMQLYSNNKKGDFNVETKIELNEEDIKNLFSAYFKDIGYAISSYDWVYPTDNNNKELELWFTVYQISIEDKHEISGLVYYRR